MPARSKAQQRFMAGVATGRIPAPPKLTKAKAREFMHRYEDGGVVERFQAGGLSSEQEANRNLIMQMSRAFAKQQGADDATAEAFGRANVAVAWTESSLISQQNAGGSPAFGLFQAYTAGGRGTGHSVQNLMNPEYNIRISLPELWGGFRSAGGAQAFAQNPVGVTHRISQLAQRPGEEELAQSLKAGNFHTGVRIAGMPVSSTAPAQVTTTKQTTTSRATTPEIANVENQIAEIQREIARINASNMPEKEKSNAVFMEMYKLKEYTQIRDRLLKGSDVEKSETTITPQQVAQQTFQNAISTYNAVGSMVHTAFADNMAVENYLLNVLKYNQDQLLSAIKTDIDRGSLTLSEASARVTAQAALQAAEVARAAEVLNYAKFISDGKWKMIERQLPPGTPYQPGFEPNGAINAALASAGLPPMVVRTQSVSRSEVDPIAHLQAASQVSGIPKPNYDMSGFDTAKGIISQVQPYTPQMYEPGNTQSLAGLYPDIIAATIDAQNQATAGIQPSAEMVTTPTAPAPGPSTQPPNAPPTLPPGGAPYADADPGLAEERRRAGTTIGGITFGI